MTKIHFLGTSSAFLGDDTSILIETNLVILLDCGFSTPKKLQELKYPLDYIDVVYISHAHGDHYFGLAELLYNFWGNDREKELTIIAEGDCIDKIIVMSSLLGKPYKNEGFIKFIKVNEESKINIQNNTFTFCRTDHVEHNLAVKINYDKKNVCFSGDGTPRKNTINFYKGCDILIHEQTFELHEEYTHSSSKTIDAISEVVDRSKIYIVHSNDSVSSSYYKPKTGEKLVIQ